MPPIDSNSSVNGISGISENNGIKSGEKAYKPNELSPDDFIKMFLAQLKNQNPMEPTDSSAILQQMSAISSIKSSDKLQATLGKLQDNVNVALGNTQMLSATQLIDKKVQILSDKSPLDKHGEGCSLSGSVYVPEKCTNVTVTIKDSGGNTVKTISLGPTGSKGLIDFSWDGLGGADGLKKYDPDLYKISATAAINGQEKEAATAGSYKVNSVAVNKTGNVIFNLDKYGGVGMSEILKIM